MGTFKFAVHLLKKEYKKSLIYGVTILFAVSTCFLFFNIINNTYLVDHTIASSGHSFNEVSVPMSTLISFMIILFCIFMLAFANNFYLSHKTKELAIMAMSGSSFMNTTFYLAYQTLLILLIALPLGLLIGCGLSFVSNYYMYSYLDVQASIFNIPLLAFRDTFVTLFTTIFAILFYNGGYVYTHDIQYLLSQENKNSFENKSIVKIPRMLYIGLYVVGLVMLFSTPYSPSAYLVPCFVGVVGAGGMVGQIIPDLILKLKKKIWITKELDLISVSNLSFSLKRSLSLVSVYCLTTVGMIAFLIAQQDNPREFITGVMGYIVIVILLSVSIMYKYSAEVSARKVFFFNLYKLGYIKKQLKAIIRKEVIAFFVLLVLIPMIYIISLLGLFYLHQAVSISFICILLLVEIIPAILMSIFTYNTYNNSVMSTIKEGTHYE